jgi:imidazolonepropionase
MGPTLFRNARIHTPVDEGRAAAGPAQGRMMHWEKGALLCRDGGIAAVGEEAAVLGALDASARRGMAEIDCGGRCMIPGFVDPHTHLCFRAPREREFLARLEGADYLSILASGGGILSSVESVRACPEEELFAATRERALSALRNGTTTIEIKSGYGLALEPELKQLRVIRRVGRETPLTVVPTFMPAHAVPPEYAGRGDAYVDLVVNVMIPRAAAEGLARYCDVFCEQGAFSVPQARRVLEAARAAGLGCRMHADELHDTGAALCAAQVRAASADHLLAASDAGLAAMAAAGVVAVLLPVTAFSMRKPYARARAMVEAGLPVAVATDCNPGSSCVESMGFAFGLSVMQMGLTVDEALTACTLNAAHALGLGAAAGSITPGKAADLLLLDGETPGILAFRTGISAVAQVYKAGKCVWRAAEGAVNPASPAGTAVDPSSLPRADAPLEAL